MRILRKIIVCSMGLFLLAGCQRFAEEQDQGHSAESEYTFVDQVTMLRISIDTETGIYEFDDVLSEGQVCSGNFCILAPFVSASRPSLDSLKGAVDAETWKVQPVIEQSNGLYQVLVTEVDGTAGWLTTFDSNDSPKVVLAVEYTGEKTFRKVNSVMLRTK